MSSKPSISIILIQNDLLCKSPQKLFPRALTVTMPFVPTSTIPTGSEGELDFIREVEVSNVVEEIEFATYGDVQADCDCETGKRVDFQACEPIGGRNVRFFSNLSLRIHSLLSQEINFKI